MVDSVCDDLFLTQELTMDKLDMYKCINNQIKRGLSLRSNNKDAGYYSLLEIKNITITEKIDIFNF